MKEGEITDMEDKLVIETNDIVDQILEDVKDDQNPEYQIAIKLADSILEDLGYSRPYNHPKKTRVTTNADGVMDEFEEEDEFDDNAPAEPDNPDKEINALNNVPNQDAGSELTALKQDIGESKELIKILEKDILEKVTVIVMKHTAKRIRENSEYKKFFQSMLAKYGVKSPSELSGDKKKAFFNAVDKGWKGKKETD